MTDPLAETPSEATATALAPSLALIEELAYEAVASLPEPWLGPASQVVIRVEDFAADELLEAMDLNDPFELTGLYEGVPLTEKSSADQVMQPDLIWLFRRAILDEWCERGNVSIGELVTHVLVHEMAHHFGWTDEQIASVDPWWE